MLGGGAATIAFMGSGGPPVETSLMRPLGEDGEWPAFPNAVVNSFGIVVDSRKICASVPPRSAPAALHFQGDPQNHARGAAEGGAPGRKRLRQDLR